VFVPLMIRLSRPPAPPTDNNDKSKLILQFHLFQVNPPECRNNKAHSKTTRRKLYESSLFLFNGNQKQKRTLRVCLEEILAGFIGEAGGSFSLEKSTSPTFPHGCDRWRLSRWLKDARGFKSVFVRAENIGQSVRDSNVRVSAWNLRQMFDALL
jgi:hypothetical protein